MNEALGHKISIVTPRPQTTRKRVLGILTGEGYQIVFVDTPGLHTLKRKGLYEYMRQATNRAIAESDIIAYMTDATSALEDDAPFLEQIRNASAAKFLLINKIDLVKKSSLLSMIDEYSRAFEFDEVVPLSALKNDGVDLFVELVVKHLPKGPPYYPGDQITDQSVRSIAAEIVREKLFVALKQELPYSVAVDVEEFKYRSNNVIYIRAIVVVEKESQKQIVIGRGGAMIKRVGQLAREELEAMLGRRVFLELFVKVRKDWSKNRRMLASLGFEKP